MGRKRTKDKHLPERMYLRAGTYYFVDHVGAWHNLGRDYVKAMGTYAQQRGPDGPCKTFATLLDRYLNEVATQKAPRSYKDNVRQARYLRAAFGECRPDDIRQRAIYAYMDARGRHSKVQANRELALLSHMFTKAIRWGIVDTNPCMRVERFKEKPRDRYIEDDEYHAFREFAGSLIAAYMDFKLLTGLRKGDILKLRLDQLKDDGIHVTVSKTGKRIIFEWIDALSQAVAAVRALPRPVRGLYLFCTRMGQPYTVEGLSSIWQRKMKQALNVGILRERFTDHDLRAKTGSDTELEHAAKLLAHLDAKTTQRHYRRKIPIVRPLK